MINLDGVSVSYNGNVTALHSVSLKLDKGKFTVLLGPSGAGKSTLLRCINLLATPTTGKIQVEKLGDISSDKALLHQHRRDTAMIFQQHQLIGRQSALRNVLVGRLGYYGSLRSLFSMPKSEKAYALECLERVGLLDKALDRVDTLSGGQQQRVGIARAIFQTPKIILADEPVASLDPASSKRVLSLLHRICKEDKLTTIVSLHQVEYAIEYADRIIGLADGRIVFDGRPELLTDAICQKIYHGKDEASDFQKDVDLVTAINEEKLLSSTS